MSTVISLNDVSAERRQRAWRDAVCETFVRLECETKKDAPFHGLLTSGQVGDLHVSRVQSSPQIVTRTKTLAAQASDAYVLLSIQTRGRTVVEQDGAQAVLTPGCLAFYDTARPYTLTLPNDFDQIVLHLPRHTIEQCAPSCLNQMAKGLSASNPFAQAILALAPQLLRLATTAPSALAHRTAAATIELISLALESLRCTEDAGDLAASSRIPVADPLNSASSEALVWRTRDLIGKQIDDTELNPAKLAYQVRVSLRRLQEVFKSQGTTPSDCIWEMRLEFARGLLASPQHRQDSVSTIAYRAGFSELAHFSRRFKQRYGISPRDYRVNS
jgi:AraC-like DNA-binding protein